MIENMTREDFMKLFGIKDDSEAMECFDEAIESSDITWYGLAKSQIRTIKFLANTSLK